MWRRFATRKPEFMQSYKTVGSVKNPIGLPATKPFTRTDNAERLRKLLNEKCFTPGVSLSESVKQFARRDEEFNTFLQEFKKKDEPKWRSILDAKKPADFQQFEKDFEKTPEQKLDELHLYEQMRKRHIIREYNKKLKQGANDGRSGSHYLREHDFGMNLTNLIENEEFHLMFLEVGSTTNVTAQQRVSQKRILMFMGNCDGMISYAIGKGWDYSTAYNHTIEGLKKNLVAIGIDPLRPCIRYLVHQFHCVKFEIFPTETGMIKGNPEYVNLLMLAGLRNCLFRVTGRNDHIYNVTRALYFALLRNITPRISAEMTGRKVYETTFGRPKKLGEVGLLTSL